MIRDDDVPLSNITRSVLLGTGSVARSMISISAPFVGVLDEL